VVELTVRNRGEHEAQGVTAACWVAKVGPGPLVWIELVPLAPQPGKVVGPAPATAPFCFAVPADTPALKGDYFVLAQASCEADRANLDPAAGLACSTGTPPADAGRVIDLVANDNNLGLRVLNFD
jgi:hypothetical protein